MRKIRIYPAPHVEIKLHVSDQMEADMKLCRNSLEALPGDRGCCDACSWNDVRFDGAGFCELPIVYEKILEEERNES